MRFCNCCLFEFLWKPFTHKSSFSFFAEFHLLSSSISWAKTFSLKLLCLEEVLILVDVYVLVCVVGVTVCTGVLPFFFFLVLGVLCYLLVSLSPCMPVAIFWNLFLVITMKRWHGPHLSCLMPFLWSNCFYAYIFSPSISRFSLWIFGSENSRTFDLTSELPGQTTRLVG